VSADVLPVDRVDILIPHNAVILGSSVYIGKWRKEAARFLSANEKTLGGRHVWLFSSGPTCKGDPISLVQDWRFLRELQSLADRIRPLDIAVLHGSMDMKKLNFLEKWLLKTSKRSSAIFVIGRPSSPGQQQSPLACGLSNCRLT
jgi:menaquinone-dependent protoporphyrinogen IX oxidase